MIQKKKKIYFRVSENGEKLTQFWIIAPTHMREIH